MSTPMAPRPASSNSDELLPAPRRQKEQREDTVRLLSPPQRGILWTSDGEDEPVAHDPPPSSPQQRDDENAEDEDDADRARREEEESIALARQLMAEEAMAVSYHMSVDYLRNNRDEFSEEDLAALQAAMDEDEAPDDEEAEDDTNDLSYDMMLRLGEHLGDVKSERWAMVAAQKISSLPTFEFDPSQVEGKDENDCSVKCFICLSKYEDKDSLIELPCRHCYHKECADNWLKLKDFCPYCRQTICAEDEKA